MSRLQQFSLFGSSYRLTVTPIDLICMVLLAVGSFGLYAVTAVPGPFDGDSGEFQYMPRLLGLPHPTGYPLYLLLGWLWSWLPVGTMAFRLNLFSAFWAMLTLLLLFMIGRMLALPRVAALCGAVALGLVAPFWQYAGLAAVYTLHTALLAAALLFWLHWSAGLRNKAANTNKRFWLAAFLTGLSLTNHPTAAFMVPTTLLFLFSHWPLLGMKRITAQKIRTTLLGALFFALPGALYLYVPIRLWMIGAGSERFGLQESIAKGWVAPFLNPSSFNVIEYMTGRGLLNDYGIEAHLLWTRLPELLIELFGLPLMIISVIGFVMWLWQRPRSWLLLFALFLPAAAYAITYDAQFTERNQIAHLEGHLMPALLVIALWIAQGINSLITILSLVMKRATLLNRLVPLLGLVALISMPTIGLQPWNQELPTAKDAQQSRSIRAYWTEVLAYPLESDAALTGHWGDLTAFWYFQHGEGLRPDLWAIFPPNLPQIERWINESDRALYLAGPLLDWSSDLSQTYHLTPWGILVRVAPRDNPPTFPPLHDKNALFGNQLQLNGYTTTSPAPKRTQLWLAWHTIAPTSRDLSVSVRLHAPDDTMLLQKDGRLASLWYPDGTMPAEQPLLSVFDLALPDELPPDTTVRIVVYDPNTIVPLLTSEGQDVFELGRFEIE